MNKNFFFLVFFVFGLLLAGCIGQGKAPTTPTTTVDKVTVDFLYADWCPHCQNMKPIIAELDKTLPDDQFVVRYWSEEDYKAGGPSKAVFEQYAANGMFQGYPTFVINNGTTYTAGEMPAAEFKGWICSQYTVKPTGC